MQLTDSKHAPAAASDLLGDPAWLDHSASICLVSPITCLLAAINKAVIFRTDQDYERFLEVLETALQRFSTKCLAYCLMPNHYHVLVVPGEHPVSRLMHQLNGTYCQWFNRHHHRVGHVLQGRYGARLVGDNDYLLTAMRYIALNPVAGGCANAPDAWRWSSYRATAGLCEPSPLLALDRVWNAFGCDDIDSGRRKFVAHVAKGGIREELEHALIFGNDLLTRRVRPLLESHRDQREFLYADRFATRPALDELFLNAHSRTALKGASYEAFHHHAYTLDEIGGAIGRAPSTICKWIRQVARDKSRNLLSTGSSLA